LEGRKEAAGDHPSGGSVGSGGAGPALGVVYAVDGVLRVGTPRRQWRRLRGLLTRSPRDRCSLLGMPQVVRALAADQPRDLVRCVTALPNRFAGLVGALLVRDGTARSGAGEPVHYDAVAARRQPVVRARRAPEAAREHTAGPVGARRRRRRARPAPVPRPCSPDAGPGDRGRAAADARTGRGNAVGHRTGRGCSRRARTKLCGAPGGPATRPRA
jgi:hypothetical protein